jgi:5-methyltetrahydrofolate--homocysteine methyltransferase
MDQLREFVKNGKTKETADQVKKLVNAGMNPDQIMQESMIPAMDEVGELFQQGEIFLPEMLMAAQAMKAGLEILRPHIVESGVRPAGRAIIGTVRGDLHDIGKNLLCMALEGAGLEVIDLGTDVPPDKFVAAIKDGRPAVLGMSALLSSTMLAMRDTIDAIKQAGLRDKVKIMVGGAPVSQQFADEIEADFFGPDCVAGKTYARGVLAKET